MRKQKILRLITQLEKHLNGLKMIPATSSYRTSVLLALLSKSLTVSRATCALITAGFPSEAFGLSRTLIDIYFAVRHIGLKDTEQRAKTYVDYNARVRKEWQILATKYLPNIPLEDIALDDEVLRTAELFKGRGNWTGLHGHTKAMALEEDLVEKNLQGLPTTGEFDYDVNYFWTSHFVHCSVVGIQGHACIPGTPFTVRARDWAEKRRGTRALANISIYVCLAFVCAFRAIHEDQPKALLELHELTKNYARRKKGV
jgi:hypothetical protein